MLAAGLPASLRFSVLPPENRALTPIYNEPMSGPIISALPLEFPRDISREHMAALPVRRYEGEVVLVASPKDFDRAWEDLAQETAVGWDTETRPAFKVSGDDQGLLQ